MEGACARGAQRRARGKRSVYAAKGPCARARGATVRTWGEGRVRGAATGATRDADARASVRPDDQCPLRGHSSLRRVHRFERHQDGDARSCVRRRRDGERSGQRVRACRSGRLPRQGRAAGQNRARCPGSRAEGLASSRSTFSRSVRHSDARECFATFASKVPCRTWRSVSITAAAGAIAVRAQALAR